MVYFVTFLESTQNTDGVFYGWLTHVDLLEPPFQGGVLFDVLAVLVQGGGADQAEFATGQHGLDDVASVHAGVAGGASPDDGVDFVDEGDDLAVCILDFLEDALQALFEFATVLGAGDHGAQVEGNEALAAQRLWYIAGNDATCKAFYDGSFADARFTDEYRVVLSAAAEDLYDSANFGVTSDDGVDFAFAGSCSEVRGVLLEGLVVVLRVFGGDASGAAHGGEGCLEVLWGGTQGLHGLGNGVPASGEADHEVLGGGVVVTHGTGEFLGGIEDGQPVPGEVGVSHASATGRGEAIHKGPCSLEEGGGVDASTVEERSSNAVLLLEECDEQVSGFYAGISFRGSGLEGGGDGLLGFGGEALGVHGVLSFSLW